MIKLTRKEWRDIRLALAKEYPLSVLLIRDVMKRELGFLDRVHTEYDHQTGSTSTICLDFYDDAKETWFRMKYL